MSIPGFWLESDTYTPIVSLFERMERETMPLNEALAILGPLLKHYVQHEGVCIMRRMSEKGYSFGKIGEIFDNLRRLCVLHL